VIGKLSLPLRLSAFLGTIVAASTAGASPMGLGAVNAMLDKDPSVAPAPAQGNTGQSTETNQQSILKQRLRKTAKSFMENGGQWDKNALYLAQSPNLNLWVTDHGLRSEYYSQSVEKGQTYKKGQVIDMSFVGGKALTHKGIDKLPTVTQFIQGKSFKDTKTVHSFGEVKLSSIYKGVDMRVYNDGDRPRYDLILQPGAKSDIIKMRFNGASSVDVNKTDLTLGTQKGLLEHRGLFAYQMKKGQKVQVPANFVKQGKNTVGIEVGTHDSSLPVVVDPIVYGTYYGGDGGIDEVRAVAADSDAGIYFTGATQAPDFPILFGPFSVNITGASDTFIAKLRGDAYVHEYSAYVGGSGRETGKFISVDPTGNRIWIAGVTTSADFPGISGSSFQAARSGSSDIFLIAFDKDALSVLTPSYSTYYGSTATTEALTGFAIAPVSGDLVVSGHANALMPGTASFPGGSTSAAFVARFAPTGQSLVWAQFHGGSAAQTSGLPTGTMGSLSGGRTGLDSDATSTITGSSVAIDSVDNILITGTVAFTGNQDTASAGTPGYPTTAGVFATGRLLRNNDIYVAKFDPDGNVVYSALLGGAGNDTGSSIAVDESGNAYLTGIASSSDFPRTTGTFGQTFTSFANVFVTKINTDGSSIVYSTNLRTQGPVIPTGIGVNQRGFAFVTGVVECSITFPNPPADPNVPNGSSTGTIFTKDPIRAANTFPGPGDLPATDGFLTILNSTAEDVLFSTYIGGHLDEMVFAPFVDGVGDVWVMGSSDSIRAYTRVSSGGTPTVFQVTDGGLDAGFITPLAFKEQIDVTGQTTFSNVPYGSRVNPQAGPLTIPSGADQGVIRMRDGFLFRFRLDIPLVQNLTLAPSSIAGGLSQQSVGTVTISGPAPAEGVDVVVSIDSTTAASLDANSAVAQQTVTIAPGATSATFTLFSSPVIDPTQVQVKAEYLGSFKIAQLTVNPWLSQLTLTPATVVSGNTSTGRVTLFTTATEDVTVALTTDNPSLISFPGGSTVTVPTGQQSANFTIQSATVDSQQSGNISASFLGKTRTQTLIVKPASLATLSFNPNRVAGGGTTTGTVTLDGNAPSTGALVTLTGITNAGNIGSMPVSVTIPAGGRSATFSLTTNLVASNTFSVVRASYNSSNKDATLLIDNISLTDFVINPTSIQGGGSVTGTVTLNQPTPPGGAFVTLSSANPEVVLPDEDPSTAGSQVLVAANSNSRSFSIGTQVVVTTINATVSASRGGAPINRALTITPVDFTISISPSSVLGGNGATMTITLTGAAPVGGVPIAISKSSVAPNPPDATGSAIVNGGNPVVISAGNTTQTFPITTTAVLETDTVQITGQIATNIHSANLTVRAPRVVGITFSPSVVRGLLVTTMTVTLDGPAPAGGAVVSLTKSPNPQILNMPSSITILAGNTSASQTLTTNKVSRTLTTQVKATYGGNNVSGSLTVTR